MQRQDVVPDAGQCRQPNLLVTLWSNGHLIGEPCDITAAAAAGITLFRELRPSSFLSCNHGIQWIAFGR